MQKYDNEYWTRVISLQSFLPGEQERHQLGPDLVAELEAMHRIDEASLPEWVPKFDPITFQNVHPQIAIKDFKLNEKELEKYAVKASDARKIINLEVDRLKSFQPQPP